MLVVFFDAVKSTPAGSYCGDSLPDWTGDVYADFDEAFNAAARAIEGLYPQLSCGDGWCVQSWWDHPEDWIAKLTFAWR